MFNNFQILELLVCSVVWKKKYLMAIIHLFQSKMVLDLWLDY